MADNVPITPGSGVNVRAISKSGVESQVGIIDLGGTGAEDLLTRADIGTDATGVTQPTGGQGIRGWLSAIYSKLLGSIAVTGTFWQATQPVSIASMPSTPVTGTFWQATQPVSIASMPSTPVTGTFWQATQPVSAAASAFADGSDATIGAKADAAGTGTVSLIALTKQLHLDLVAATPAGSAVIGQVGIDQTTPGTTNRVFAGGTSSVAVTPTLTVAAHAINTVCGSALTFANAFGSAGSGVLDSIILTSKAVQTTGFKLYLFKANPSNTTWTDAGTPAIAAADIANLIGVYSFGPPDSNLGTVTLWEADAITKAINAGGTSLYGVLICTAAFTPASTSDLTVTINILKD